MEGRSVLTGTEIMPFHSKFLIPLCAAGVLAPLFTAQTARPEQKPKLTPRELFLVPVRQILPIRDRRGSCLPVEVRKRGKGIRRLPAGLYSPVAARSSKLL